MKKAKKLLIAILVITMSLSSVAYAFELTEDGLMPIRAIFEQSGAEVTWNEDERSVLISITDAGFPLFPIDGQTEILLFPGQINAYINGNPIALSEAVVIRQNTAFMSPADLNLIAMAMMPTVTLELTEEARDIALYDFEIMYGMIFENSIWPYIAYRRTGVDMGELLGQNRALIESMQPITVPLMLIADELKDGDDARSLAANYLFGLTMTTLTMPFEGLGHMMVYPLMGHNLVLGAILAAEDNEYLRKMYAVHTHPSALWFYGEHTIIEQGDGMTQNPYNVTTEILVPNEIAYMRIETFMNNPLIDDAIILAFLQEVEDYEHLIIDIRGNPGGIANHFFASVMARLVNEPVDVAEHQFLPGTDLAMGWVDAFMEQFYGVEGLESSITPAAEFISDNAFTHFNEDNLEILEYVLSYSFVLAPLEDAVNFNGEIWLLVDGNSASASTGVTLAVLSTGFATVVGENTHHVMNVLHAVKAMPNTGMIFRVDIGFVVDSYGRNVEVGGIPPQVPNHPNMDALETVLALIG